MPDPPVRVALFIHTLHLGGAEGQLSLLLRSLDRRRVQASLLAFHAEGHHAETLAARGIPTRTVPLPSRLAHPATAATVLWLAAWCRRNRVEVLHAHDFYTNLVALPAARLSGAGCLVSRLDLSHWYGGLRRAALAAVSRAADRVWVNAEAVRRLVVLEDHVAPARVTLIRNGIDLAGFDRSAGAPAPGAIDLSGPDIEPFVICVANMNHPVKGQEDLLAAMVEVAARAPRAHLLLVGDGPLRPDYERRARELGLGPRVRFAGRRPDVPALLSRADVAVSASHAEGLSNAVIEAMAARLPVVATAVGGNVELLRDGVDGFLVPPHAPWALADRILRLLDRPGLAREMGASGRRRVEEELPARRMVASFEALYERMARGRRARRRSESAARSAGKESGPAVVAQPAPE